MKWNVLTWWRLLNAQFTLKAWNTQYYQICDRTIETLLSEKMNIGKNLYEYARHCSDVGIPRYLHRYPAKMYTIDI